MSTWTMYWPEWVCDAARERGLAGQPLRLLWGGHNQESTFHGKIAAGDVIIPIALREGSIHPLAALVVKERTDATTWLLAHPEDAQLRMPECGPQLLVGEPRHPLDFDRSLTPEQAEAWRFDASNEPRPIKFLEQGRVMRSLPLQGIFRVTADTAAMLEKVLAAPAQTRPALEQHYASAPADAQRARVLADQWLERGDPRGQLLMLELELARTSSLAEATELDRQLTAAARAAKGVKSQPGGFPFRHVFGARTYVELSAQKMPLSGITPEQMLRTVGAHFAPGTSWNLDGKKLTLAQTLAALEPGHVAFIEGILVAPGTTTPLPLQSAPLWLGSRPVSMAWVAVDKRVASWLLRIPEGSPVCAAAVRALKKPKWQALRMVRTARGSRRADAPT